MIQLLSKAERFDNARLQEIINSFIKGCEERSLFPWQYYYVKYKVSRPQRGMMKNLLPFSGSYMFLVLNNAFRKTRNSYISYLKEVDPEHLSRESNGRRLVYADWFVVCRNDSFAVCRNQTELELGSIKITKNSAGIDTENRIEKLKAYLKEHVQR